MGGHQEEPQVSPSLLAGGCHSLVPSRCTWRSLARPLSGSLAEPGGGGLRAGVGGLCVPVSQAHIYFLRC